jgi:hypothetical protein
MEMERQLRDNGKAMERQWKSNEETKRTYEEETDTEDAKRKEKEEVKKRKEEEQGQPHHDYTHPP